jgi:hypothetical protein
MDHGNNIDFEKVGCDDAKGIHLAQDIGSSFLTISCDLNQLLDFKIL